MGVQGIGGRFIHSNLWPRNARDRFLLVGGESSGPTCGSDSAVFMTFDTRSWLSRGKLRLVDEYRLANGLPTEGEAAANLFCTHWFETRPGFRNGGVVALAWYEHGSRFLRVRKNGKIDEIGWFVPHGGSTSANYWASRNIVYAVDYNRGLDILRFRG